MSPPLNEEALVELSPLAALGALDGEDARLFALGRPRSAAVERELASFERVAARIGLAVPPVEPSTLLRSRVRGATSPEVAHARPRGRTPSWSVWLPLAAAAALAVTALVFRGQRDLARREASRSEAEVATLLAQNRDLEQRLRATHERLLVAEAFRSLVAQPTTRLSVLAGLPAAPASRGRVVWSAERREAVLLATGLPEAPPGKAYEAWVIAGGAPVAAGVFRVDASGSGVHPLPRLDEVSRAQTFAVTLEPEGGTQAPTGPMVLAGPAL